MLSRFIKTEKFNNEEGFTLIELLIVIIIVGILAAISIPAFILQQRHATVASVRSDVKNTMLNVTLYFTKHHNATGVFSASIAGESGATQEPASSRALVPIVKSDPNTSIEVFGSWNNYYVFATNSGVGDPAVLVVGGSPTDVSLPTSGNTFGVLYSAVNAKTVVYDGSEVE